MHDDMGADNLQVIINSLQYFVKTFGAKLLVGAMCRPIGVTSPRPCDLFRVAYDCKLVNNIVQCAAVPTSAYFSWSSC